MLPSRSVGCSACIALTIYLVSYCLATNYFPGTVLMKTYTHFRIIAIKRPLN